mmetsp:Transcript_71392/g.126113  ORF Transcript_71392/g.126113 Transcript_71392/m.126113 type:complete len:108 (+) Transcript_71392:60-383(+)|eukprot:CAMPEP_0197653172 /NCGR_PEP_ID=MMETSP1338-20131121/34899_1 /TAXON_ID=43686 ORGANISM="Pelagodinium beii, Strain RCC1491" /NCGR_SAMPLE_ID=MMETSP1338 /ASSEMBLY_ACC=CAM_ASM_000754 /LENGTH=107 /DNA_ID=CAMNT_0043228207 /DNA_START=33 /DNA_END=356 /DNA_ORIENTATION=+
MEVPRSPSMKRLSAMLFEADAENEESKPSEDKAETLVCLPSDISPTPTKRFGRSISLDSTEAGELSRLNSFDDYEKHIVAIDREGKGHWLHLEPLSGQDDQWMHTQS